MSKTELQILSLAARPQGIQMGDPEFHALGTNRIRLWFNLERGGYISSEDDGPYRLTEKGMLVHKSEIKAPKA